MAGKYGFGRSGWSIRAGQVAVFVALAFATASTSAQQLVPQMERCVPPIEQAVADPVIGYGNDAAHRNLHVTFAWAHDGANTADQAIQGTQRAEICWFDFPVSNPSFNSEPAHCPGWSPGGSAWVLFDTNTPIGAPPSSSDVDLVGAADNRKEIFVPLDWDDGSVAKVAVIVVNAAKKPTTISDVSADLTNGGWCVVPFRLAAKDGKVGTTPPPPATTSTSGSVTGPNTNFVAYGVTNALSLFVPATWSFGDPCSQTPYKAKLALAKSQCVALGAVEYGLDRLQQIDDWQFDIAQGGLISVGAAKRTWQNGTGSGTTTCAPGKTCPTRTILSLNTQGAGADWGGVFSQTIGPFTSAPVDPFTNAATDIIRNQAHEYFHGLGNTWTHATKSPLYGHAYILESLAATATLGTCLTDYPGKGVDQLLPTKCVSAHTLHRTYYDDFASSANAYLQSRLNPFVSYPGGLFYRYVAATPRSATPALIGSPAVRDAERHA